MAEHGTFTWNELNTRDPDAARAFYGALCGWTFESMPMPDGTYWVAKRGDAPVAGIFTMAGPQFEGIPEHWFTYIALDDVDAGVAATLEAGGQVIRPCFDVPDVGRIAIIRDKSGAALGIMTEPRPAT
jgi:uncharacterized protein